MNGTQLRRSRLSSNTFQGLRMQTTPRIPMQTWIWTFLPQKEPKELPGTHMSNPTWETWWYVHSLFLPKNIHS